MSRKNFLQFRPSLESLDVRAMPSATLMLACATGVHVNQTPTLAASSSGGESKGDIEPVVDADGGLWLCRETENSCECIPW